MKPRTYLLVVGIITAPAILGGLLMLESVLEQVRSGDSPETTGFFYACFGWMIAGPPLVAWLVKVFRPDFDLELSSPEEAELWRKRVLLAAFVYFGVAVAGLGVFLVRYHSATGGLLGLYEFGRPHRRSSWIPHGVAPEYLYLMIVSLVWWFKSQDRIVLRGHEFKFRRDAP